MVAVLSPGLQPQPRLVQRSELVHVQALVQRLGREFRSVIDSHRVRQRPDQGDCVRGIDDTLPREREVRLLRNA